MTPSASSAALRIATANARGHPSPVPPGRARATHHRAGDEGDQPPHRRRVPGPDRAVPGAERGEQQVVGGHRRQQADQSAQGTRRERPGGRAQRKGDATQTPMAFVGTRRL